MEYIMCRIKRLKFKKNKKLKRILCFYVLAILLLIAFVFDSILFNIPSQNTQTVIGKAAVAQVLPRTISGTYSMIILDINNERFVLYHRSGFKKKVSYGYFELSELIKNEGILEFTVEEQMNVLPAKYGDLKSIVDIRNDETVYVDIEDTNADKKIQIFATVGIAVFLFLSISILFLMRIFLMI